MPPGYHPLDVEKEWGKLHVAILEREKQLRSEFERWAGTAVGEAAGGWGPAVAGKPPRVSHCLGRKSPPPGWETHTQGQLSCGRGPAGRPGAGGSCSQCRGAWRPDPTHGGSRGRSGLQTGVSSADCEQTADGGRAV